AATPSRTMTSLPALSGTYLPDSTPATAEEARREGPSVIPGAGCPPAGAAGSSGVRKRCAAVRSVDRRRARHGEQQHFERRLRLLAVQPFGDLRPPQGKVQLDELQIRLNGRRGPVDPLHSMPPFPRRNRR